jgi:lysozyme family protein
MCDIKFYLPLVRQLEGSLDRDTYDAAAAHPCPTPYFGESGWHTNCGITWSIWSEVIGNDVQATERWFKMSDDDLAFIVGKFYWNPINCNSIVSIPVAIIFCDWDYNSGQGTATKHIQRIVGVDDDGICGNGTITAINSKEPNTLYQDIMAARKAFYISLNNQKEIDGWLNRLDKIDAYIKTLNLHV